MVVIMHIRHRVARQAAYIAQTTRQLTSTLPIFDENDKQNKHAPLPPHFKTHHAPIDEFIQGLAGGHQPGQSLEEQEEEGAAHVYRATDDVPDPEYPHIGVKEAISMAADAIFHRNEPTSKGGGGGGGGYEDNKHTASQHPMKQQEEAKSSPTSSSTATGSVDVHEDLKDEADTSMKGGKPSPNIVLE